MADQIAVVTFTTPASNSVVSVTDPSITEAFSSAILIFSRETADDTDNAHGVMGLGFIADDIGSPSTENVCSSCQIENGVHPMDANSGGSTSRAIQASTGLFDGPLSADTDYAIIGTFNGAVSGGFELNFTKTAAQAKCVAVIFAGISRAACDTCGNTGTREDTGSAGNEFEPDLVVFRAADNLVSNRNVNATIALGFAVNDGTPSQACSYINIDDSADPTDSDGFFRDDRAWGGFSGTTRTSQDNGIVTGFDAAGFTYDITTDGVSPQAQYLALKLSDPGANIACVNLAIAASTGVQSFNVGFTPRVVIGMSTLLTTEDSLTDGTIASSAGYFAFSSDNARAYTVHSREGLNTSNIPSVLTEAHTRQGDYALLTYDHLGAVAHQATLSGFTATGFDLNFATATAAGYMTVLAIGLGAQTLVANEAVGITDSCAFGTFMVCNETVGIADTCVTMTNTIVTGSDQYGLTMEAGSRRGTSLASGAAAGTVL